MRYRVSYSKRNIHDTILHLSLICFGYVITSTDAPLIAHIYSSGLDYINVQNMGIQRLPYSNNEYRITALSINPLARVSIVKIPLKLKSCPYRWLMTRPHMSKTSIHKDYHVLPSSIITSFFTHELSCRTPPFDLPPDLIPMPHRIIKVVVLYGLPFQGLPEPS